MENERINLLPLTNQPHCNIDETGMHWYDEGGKETHRLAGDGFYFIRGDRERRIYPRRQWRWRKRAVLNEHNGGA